MAVVHSPLMSLDASGSVAKSIVFSKWKGRNYVRKLIKPSNPKSGLQTGMRAGVKFMTQIYASLSAGIKANWKTVGTKKSITALNAMVQTNQPKLRTNLGLLEDPTFTAGAVEAAPTGVTATAATETVNLAWTDSAGANDWCTFIYQSTTTGFTPDISNLVAVVGHGVQKLTVPRLKTGTPYYFVLGGCEHGGTLGTHAAQVTATPT